MRATIIHDGPVARQATARLVVETKGQGFVEITRAAHEALAIQENADPDVARDLLDALDGLAPRTAPYRHGSEGPDDMPAHIRSMLTGPSVAIPIVEGALALGTWQGLYLVEHRDSPHRREVLLVMQGA